MNYSNWRQDLTEVMTEKEDDKKVTEKNIKNKITINPKLGEAIESMGGKLLEVVEMKEPDQPQDPQEKEREDPKQKKINMVKKQVLLKKMQAVRQGAGADIVAHYSPEGDQIDEKKGCSHTHKGDECPVHVKEECPDIVAAEVDEGKGDPCWDSHKQVGMKKKGNRMVPNCVPKESTEDSLRDRRMERGGVDGNNRYDKPISNTPNTFGKKKPKKDGPSAMDIVKAQIRAKHGQGAIIDTKKEETEIGEAITSEKGKAKLKSMIDDRTDGSGRAKKGKGQNVKDINHIGRANVDGYGGTPPNLKVAKNPVKSNFSGLNVGTGNKAKRRADALTKKK